MRDLVVEKAQFRKREYRRTHPLKCELCGQRITSPKAMKKHKEVKHKIFDPLRSLFCVTS